MENALQVFENQEFGKVRTVVEQEQVLFCASDVAKALGYSRPADAVTAHCRGSVKRRLIDNLGRGQETKFIPEGDVYRLIIRSKLPTAEKFERWVFDEVLPSIRKHGGYLTPEKIEDVLLNPDTIIKLATELKEERAKRMAHEKQIEQDKPKVLFADSVSVSHTSILIGELAKLLQQNGVPMGQNRLFQWLRENGYLIRRKGTDYNMPTQRAMEMGLFEVKETVVSHSDGHTSISKTPKVTGKGQIYFINKFLEGATLAKAGGER